MARPPQLAALANVFLLTLLLGAPTTEARAHKRACKLACAKGLICQFKGGRQQCAVDPNYRGSTVGTSDNGTTDGSGSQPPLPSHDGPSCMTIRCSANHTCVDYTDGTPSRCVRICTLQCQTFGGHCEVNKNGDEICVPNEVGPTCETIRCMAGYECQDNIGLPSKCVKKECNLICVTFGGVCGFDENGNQICIKKDVGPTCDTIRCDVGFECQDNIGLPSECVPISSNPPATCASTTCVAPSDCVDTPEGAKCMPPGSTAGGSSGSSGGSSGSGGDGDAPSGCAAVLCRAGTTCVANTGGVACVEDPSTKPDPCADAGSCPDDNFLCTPNPDHEGVLCLPANGNTGVAGTKACANIVCPSNTACVQNDVDHYATCMPQPKPDPCAAAGSCPPELYCTQINGGVQCLPANGNTGIAGSKRCSNIICPNNTRCAQETDFATCVFAKPDQGPCATAGTCPSSFHCMHNPDHEGVLCLPENGNTGIAGTKKCSNIICPSNTRCAQHAGYATCVPKRPRGF